MFDGRSIAGSDSAMDYMNVGYMASLMHSIAPLI
jgi:hypothetical protein